MSIKRLLIAVFLLFQMTWGLAGCAGPKPIEDIVLARAAMDAARTVGAQSSAPGYYHKSEESYHLGQIALKGNYNREAQLHFANARMYAEKAENVTRLKKFKSGEALP